MNTTPHDANPEALAASWARLVAAFARASASPSTAHAAALDEARVAVAHSCSRRAADPLDPPELLDVDPDQRAQAVRLAWATLPAATATAPLEPARLSSLRASLVPAAPDQQPQGEAARALAAQTILAYLALVDVERSPGFERSVAAPETSPARWSALLDADQRATSDGVGPGEGWFNAAFISATADPAPAEPGAASVVIRPSFRGSAGRRVEGSLVFPPGTRFVVARSPDGAPVVLRERSRFAARWDASTVTSPPPDSLYHYTLGRSLPGIVDDDEIGVAVAPRGTRAPVVWLSTRHDWEPSIVKSETRDGQRHELTVAELADRCGGLFRIRVDAAVGVVAWRDFVTHARVDRSFADGLDRSGRARGAEPERWYCCPWAIARAHWLSIDAHDPERGWQALAI